MIHDVKAFLDAKVAQYNRPEFIENDPIVIPHSFTLKQDIEIMGFWAAILAWGQRVTIIKKCRELITLMDGAPYDFIINHQEPDLKKLLTFKHRTFNDTDTLYFIQFFRYHYENFDSLEDAFLKPPAPLKGEVESQLPHSKYKSFIPPLGGQGVESSLNHFRSYFFSLPDYPHRTKKHISSPSQKSTCKRLNMFLRWMVRKDDCGVDFGLWNRLKPAELIMPCDLHVDRVARNLKLITRKQTDWQTAVELTEHLRQFDPLDPVKYDFALFGLGIEEKFGFGL
ncbi:TIGR02757 family protein [Mucilaginibacter sp. KACC 22063]|uniref:TIGR02757 family protein n=1 Tax=Mucilaginibacter sp. KACC 22063 TaxID=3025666 RepID=UPI00236671BD|nr:TIGR02757 family protein [Mucilaginibacter sp. KACC 22063]WDF53707.1 TIGR02757 family protein [Mucilaginibacter sp. KACC 22063]